MSDRDFDFLEVSSDDAFSDPNDNEVDLDFFGEADHEKQYNIKEIYKSDFTIVTSQFMNGKAIELQATLPLPRVYLRLLLDYSEWDLQLSWSAYERPQGLKETVPEFENLQSLNIHEWGNATQGQGKCEICFSKRNKKLIGTFCGHLNCRQCWQKYVTLKIKEDEVYRGIQCMQDRCDILLDNDFVEDIVTSSKLKLRYHNQMFNNIVTRSKHLWFCPRPRCESILYVKTASFGPGVCDCGYEVCLSCGADAHNPVNCHLHEVWNRKLALDQISDSYISAFTQKCPQCKVSIEKNDGCNIMTCRMCENKFCWLCLQHIKDYSHKCPRFEEENVKEKQLSEQAKLKRYEFYLHRYLRHRESFKLENNFHEAHDKKQQSISLKNIGSTEIDIKNLKKAINVLCQCRKTLMNSYIFSYFLQDNIQTTIFLDNQENLHEAVEQLSENIYEEIERQGYSSSFIGGDIKGKVKYCRQRQKTLLEHVYEGTEDDSWKYRSEDL